MSYIILIVVWIVIAVIVALGFGAMARSSEKKEGQDHV